MHRIFGKTKPATYVWLSSQYLSISWSQSLGESNSSFLIRTPWFWVTVNKKPFLLPLSHFYQMYPPHIMYWKLQWRKIREFRLLQSTNDQRYDNSPHGQSSTIKSLLIHLEHDYSQTHSCVHTHTHTPTRKQKRNHIKHDYMHVLIRYMSRDIFVPGSAVVYCTITNQRYSERNHIRETLGVSEVQVLKACSLVDYDMP